MGKASIHIQKASGGAITHNSRENYSKSVVFIDEVNELWNDKKQAYEIYRSELKKRVEAYTNRTNQKLQKKAVTHLSAVVNLERHHTLKDLESIKDELEKVFDTKVFQIAIHRDEGKIKHKETGDYFVSGIDFFYNPDDKKYYSKKDKHTFSNEINIDEYDIEKNYHAHIELMGLDSEGQAIRQKMNRYVLSNLQDFTAIALNMARGNNYQIKKSAKRLDTHEFKASKKRENEVKKIVKTEKNKVIKQANEIIKNHKEDKHKLKSDLDFVKNEFKSIREMLKGTGATREDFKKIDDLNKQLQNDLKNNDIDLAKATEEIKNLIIDLKIDNKIKDEKVKELTNLAYSNVLYNNTNDRVPYKILNEDKKKKLKEKDKLIKELNEKIKSYDNQISHIENLLLQVDNLLLEIDTKVSQIESLEKENIILKENNEALKKENEDLANENIKLKEIINSRENMSDYEDIKKENESLKKENSFLNSTINKILNFANEKIKDLFKFKIYNDVVFKQSDDHLLLEDWEKRCNDRYKLETDYNKQIENELLKEKDFEKVEDNHKSNLNGLEMLNKNLDEFVKPNQKKEDLDYSNNLLHR